MNDRDYLSELEQLVLLAVLQLPAEDAYGAEIRRVLDRTAGRSVSVATVHVALSRLEERELARSAMSEPSGGRGGRSRRMYEVTDEGIAALERTRETQERMWQRARAALEKGAR